jgi:hypothetical protein
MNLKKDNPDGVRPAEEKRSFDLRAVYLVMIRAYLRQRQQQKAQLPLSEVAND